MTTHFSWTVLAIATTCFFANTSFAAQSDSGDAAYKNAQSLDIKNASSTDPQTRLSVQQAYEKARDLYEAEDRPEKAARAQWYATYIECSNPDFPAEQGLSKLEDLADVYLEKDSHDRAECRNISFRMSYIFRRNGNQQKTEQWFQKARNYNNAQD